MTRTSTDGTVEILVDRYRGKRLNSPNDLAIRSDGMIWFTDPPYGLKDRKREQEANHVFRLDPRRKRIVAEVRDFDRPNGLCLSPDEKRLYIADSGKPAHIRVFAVKPDGGLEKGRVFCTIDKGGPDGIRCDAKGRVFSSAGDGVQVFLPTGKRIAGSSFRNRRPISASADPRGAPCSSRRENPSMPSP